MGKLMSSKVRSLLLCALLLALPSLAAAQSFLTLPFPRGENSTTGDTVMNVQQGWYYTGSSLHSGIDYIEGTIDNSSTWQHFPIVAAADGEACADDEDGGSCVTGPGKKVLIRHNRTSRTLSHKLLSLLTISFQGHTGLKNNQNRIKSFQRGAECATI